MSATKFNPGEEFIQEQSGERAIALQNGGIISNRLAGGAAIFLQGQEIFYASSMDQDEQVWVSVLKGKPGFSQLREQQHIYLDPSLLLTNPADIFWKNIEHSSGVGLLYIELISRRRLRVNGWISNAGKTWDILVEQAYPNCPKYIQRRELMEGPTAQQKTGSSVREWIKKADTIFVGSADNDGHLDVSHRGGETGFISLINEDTLRIPDYEGNSMFNTLGNFHLNPAAGILIVDYNTGDTLQMTGKALVHLHEDDRLVHSGGTGRFWDFRIEKTVFGTSLYDFTSRFIDFSPFNP